MLLKDENLQYVLDLPKPFKQHAFLISGTLLLQIKENQHDKCAKKESIWVPPRDFKLLRSEPFPKCFVELALINLRYVSEFKEDPPTPGFFEYVLYKSPMVRMAWDEFRGTFLQGD